ncbi:MAG: hydrolase, partial [Sarcina sp.]
EKLKKSEQHHSIRVCKESIYILKNNKEYIELNEKEVGKVSLLHDIGKIKYPINLIEKSLLVILNKITKGKIKRFSNIKCIDTYYNHPIYSIEILNTLIEAQYSNGFIDAIKNHHFNNVSFNGLLNILREADNKC